MLQNKSEALLQNNSMTTPLKQMDYSFDSLPRANNQTAEGSRNTLKMMAQNSLEKLKPMNGNYTSVNPKSVLNTAKRPKVHPGYMYERAQTSLDNSMEVVGFPKRRSISQQGMMGPDTRSMVAMRRAKLVDVPYSELYPGHDNTAKPLY